MVKMFRLVEEERNNKSRHKFRQVARESSGEIFDIPEENRVFFAYETNPVRGPIAVGAISFKVADVNAPKDDPQFTSEYFHQLTFLFVRPQFQTKGVGKMLFKKFVSTIHRLRAVRDRSVRVQSAKNAESFFWRLGFVTRGDPIEIVCGGSFLFRTLINMELVNY